MKKLVQLGFNPLKRSDLNETLLFYAENSDIAEYLIQQGVNVNHQSKESISALLLANGAAPCPLDNEGNTPLDQARYYGNKEAIQMLERHCHSQKEGI